MACTTGCPPPWQSTVAKKVSQLIDLYIYHKSLLLIYLCRWHYDVIKRWPLFSDVHVQMSSRIVPNLKQAQTSTAIASTKFTHDGRPHFLTAKFGCHFFFESQQNQIWLSGLRHGMSVGCEHPHNEEKELLRAAEDAPKVKASRKTLQTDGTDDIIGLRCPIRPHNARAGQTWQAGFGFYNLFKFAELTLIAIGCAVAEIGLRVLHVVHPPRFQWVLVSCQIIVKGLR